MIITHCTTSLRYYLTSTQLSWLDFFVSRYNLFSHFYTSFILLCNKFCIYFLILSWVEYILYILIRFVHDPMHIILLLNMTQCILFYYSKKSQTLTDINLFSPILMVWIFQVLTNGIEVKLQRNALSVIEAPTGNEEDDDVEVGHTQWNPSDMSKLGSLSTTLRCLSVKYMFFDCVFAACEDTLKPHKSKQRGYRSARLSHKAMCRALSSDSHSKSSTITPPVNMVINVFELDGYAFKCFWLLMMKCIWL